MYFSPYVPSRRPEMEGSSVKGRWRRVSILATSMTAIVFAVVYLNVDELSRGSSNHAFLAEDSYSSEATSIVSQDYSSSDFVAHGSTSPSGGSGTGKVVCACM